jgi:hypothetical protein
VVGASRKSTIRVCDDMLPNSDIMQRSIVQPPLYSRVPTGAVKPAGWAKDQALVQANGLAGHLRDFDS